MVVLFRRTYLNTEEDTILQGEADGMKRAMKGLGTDAGPVVRIIANRDDRQISKIRTFFESDEDAQSGGNLEAWIKDDFSGDIEDLMLSVVQGQAISDAEALYKAIHTQKDGLTGMAEGGTDENTIIEICSTRSNAELQAIQAEYRRMYSKDLTSELQGESSGNFEDGLVCILDRAGFMADRLHSAIKNAGTDEKKIIRVVTALLGDNRRLLGVLNDPQLNRLYDMHNGIAHALRYELDGIEINDVARRYQEKHGSSLTDDIASDTSGFFQELLMSLFKTKAMQDAEFIHTACEGMGTKDKHLIEVLCCRTKGEVLEIADAYQSMYGKSLIDEIKSETSGDYQDFLVALATPRAELLARQIHRAMAGFGTKERTLYRCIVGRSQPELRDIDSAYKRLFDKDLESAVEGDTSFWEEKALRLMISNANRNQLYAHERDLNMRRDL